MPSLPETEATPLQGVLIVTPPRHCDERGWFSEIWNARTMAELGLDIRFVQDNQARSLRRHTLRGLHFQAPPRAQAKLVRCTRGAVFDVVVDIRAGSPSEGSWFGIELTEENGRQLFVPEGFAHGYLTLTEGAEIEYKCSDFYAPAAEGAVRWDSCGIDWPIAGEPILSPKDAAAPALAELTSPFTWSEER